MRLLVFDSGVGGVGVAAELRRLCPHAGIAYLMDDAGFPYGGRTPADLTARVLGVLGAGIARLRPELVVVACNTATTLALAALRAAYPLPFVGCVPPIKSAAALTRTGTIGVLATPATLRAPALHALAAEHAPGCRVLLHGAAGLAALAEARFAGAAVAQVAVSREVSPLADQPGADRLDVVALGCTHYALLLPELRACLPGVAWLDPAGPVARQAQRVAATLAGTTDDAAPDGLVLRTRGGGAPPGPGWQAAGLCRADTLPGFERETAGAAPG